MVFAVLLVIVLFVIAVTALPAWSHSKNWGYVPSSSLGVLLVGVIVLLLTGVL